jgi:hypothetical protein
MVTGMAHTSFEEFIEFEVVDFRNYCIIRRVERRGERGQANCKVFDFKGRARLPPSRFSHGKPISASRLGGSLALPSTFGTLQLSWESGENLNAEGGRRKEEGQYAACGFASHS